MSKIARNHMARLCSRLATQSRQHSDSCDALGSHPGQMERFCPLIQMS